MAAAEGKSRKRSKARRRKRGETDAQYERRIRELDKARERMRRKRERERRALADGTAAPTTQIRDEARARRDAIKASEHLKATAPEPAPPAPTPAPVAPDHAPPAPEPKPPAPEPKPPAPEPNVRPTASKSEPTEASRTKTRGSLSKSAESELISTPHYIASRALEGASSSGRGAGFNFYFSSATPAAPGYPAVSHTYRDGPSGANANAGGASVRGRTSPPPLKGGGDVLQPRTGGPSQVRPPRPAPPGSVQSLAGSTTSVRECESGSELIQDIPAALAELPELRFDPVTAAVDVVPRPLHERVKLPRLSQPQLAVELRVGLAAEMLVVAYWLMQVRARERVHSCRSDVEALVLRFGELQRHGIVASLRRAFYCGGGHSVFLPWWPLDYMPFGFYQFAGWLACWCQIRAEVEWTIDDLNEWMGWAPPSCAFPREVCPHTADDVLTMYRLFVVPELRAGTFALLTDD